MTGEDFWFRQAAATVGVARNFEEAAARFVDCGSIETAYRAHACNMSAAEYYLAAVCALLRALRTDDRVCRRCGGPMDGPACDPEARAVEQRFAAREAETRRQRKVAEYGAARFVEGCSPSGGHYDDCRCEEHPRRK
jgi:hypothetical protein